MRENARRCGRIEAEQYTIRGRLEEDIAEEFRLSQGSFRSIFFFPFIGIRTRKPAPWIKPWAGPMPADDTPLRSIIDGRRRRKTAYRVTLNDKDKRKGVSIQNFF